MSFLVVKHKVEDYGRWKPEFDGDADNRKSHGSKGAYVLRMLDDPNDLVVITWWESVQGMKEFMESPDLKGAMKRGGVMGMPDLYMCELVEKAEF